MAMYRHPEEEARQKIAEAFARGFVNFCQFMATAWTLLTVAIAVCAIVLAYVHPELLRQLLGALNSLLPGQGN